ncbi:MAG: hypothetical protein COZ05_21490, partial [Armatimonadetes bacterium CG_4_10_14_3_um_filter_59_10]
YELLALEGAGEFLETKCIRSLYIELYRQAGDEYREHGVRIRDTMRKFGYRCYVYDPWRVGFVPEKGISEAVNGLFLIDDVKSDKKIKSIICFIRSAADFNNPIGLVSSKIFSNTNVIVYRYHQYRLLSFESFADGVSIRECLSEKIYHEALKRSCPKGGSGTYVNLGANIGAFDIALNSVWSGCSVKGVSVEMNPWTCARLASNIHWNRLDARVLNAAVGPARGETSLDIAKTGPGQSLYHSVPDSRATAVNMIKLSDVPSPATPADCSAFFVRASSSRHLEQPDPNT